MSQNRRYSEIRDFQLFSIRMNQDAWGFNISVNDAPGMQIPQRCRNISRRRQKCFEIKFLIIAEIMINRNSLKILQDKGKAPFIIDDVDGFDNVFNIEIFNQFAFLPELGDFRRSRIYRP